MMKKEKKRKEKKRKERKRERGHLGQNLSAALSERPCRGAKDDPKHLTFNTQGLGMRMREAEEEALLVSAEPRLVMRLYTAKLLHGTSGTLLLSLLTLDECCKKARIPVDRCPPYSPYTTSQNSRYHNSEGNILHRVYSIQLTYIVLLLLLLLISFIIQEFYLAAFLYS